MSATTVPAPAVISALEPTYLAVTSPAVQLPPGSLVRVSGWVKVLGFVNCAPGFSSTPLVLNGFSDTIVTETILPAQFDYPLGLGAAMTVGASAESRVLDVYVQGFNADMLMTATMSGGGSVSFLASPTKNPPGSGTTVSR